MGTTTRCRERCARIGPGRKGESPAMGLGSTRCCSADAGCPPIGEDVDYGGRGVEPLCGRGPPVRHHTQRVCRVPRPRCRWTRRQSGAGEERPRVRRTGAIGRVSRLPPRDLRRRLVPREQDGQRFPKTHKVAVVRSGRDAVRVGRRVTRVSAMDERQEDAVSPGGSRVLSPLVGRASDPSDGCGWRGS